MKALWLENNQISIREVPEPKIEDEALICIRKAGICATDLELVTGYYPFTGIPGHEFVGEVVSCNDESWIGQRIVGDINISCKRCEQCGHGRYSHCENRTVLGISKRNGVFTEFTTLPLTNLHRIPDSIPDEIAVFTEPLAAALEIQEQIQIQPGNRILVIGAGRLGQLIAQTLALTGCNLHVLARYENQKKILIDRDIKSISEDDIQPGRWDIVVEATGSSSGFSLARQAVRPRGTIVLKSTYKGEISVNFSSIVVDEINLIGSRCGPFEPALRLMEMGLVNPSVLISEEYRLDEAIKAFERASKPSVLKVLLEP